MRPQGSGRGKPAKTSMCMRELNQSRSKDILCFTGGGGESYVLSLGSQSQWPKRVGKEPLLPNIFPVLLIPPSPSYYTLPFVTYCCLPFPLLHMLVCLSTFTINFSWLFALFFVCFCQGRGKQQTKPDCPNLWNT